ncbi:uncharacterized protein LOC129599331 [Paramacrobiotus metropolitanus]|uniref:uncharacterized protein LOC129599331 n=1 Tax=Paramacrobiotus metropolitanus TaxID=2943436 RepID=UPI002445D209|nr:uncharacterized protein LOC129599331 [Paramacrobiotus metropolitanus]
MDNFSVNSRTTCGQNYDPGILPTPLRLLAIVSYPVLLVLCTIGNGAVVCLWARKLRQTSTNVYLVLMSFLSILYMWIQLPIRIMDYNSSQDARHANSSLANSLLDSFGAITCIGNTLINSVDWILVIYSGERMVAIIRPLWNRLLSIIICYDTTKRPRLLCSSGPASPLTGS